MNAWKHLAQEKQQVELVHQTAKAFASTGDWPLLALAQKQGEQVRLLAGYLNGSPLPQLEYTLRQAPCAALYRPKRVSDPVIYSSQPERFIHWPLVKHFIWQTYLAQQLELPSHLGQFHLFVLAKDPHLQQKLPKDLLLTGSERIAAALIRQAENRELQTLRQIQHAHPLAFARLCPLGKLHQLSGGLAQLLNNSTQPNKPLFFNELVELTSNDHLAELLTQQQSSIHYCTLRLPDGTNRPQLLSLTPISSQLGFIASFSDPQLSGNQAIIEQRQKEQQFELLQQRVEQELARIRRNNQVAALFFVEPIEGQVSQTQWHSLKQELSNLFRQEDLIVQPTDQVLIVLTACFENNSQVPLQQMNTMAHKLHRKLHNQPLGHHWQIKTRLLTQWDVDIEHLLNSNHSVTWQHT